MNKRILAAILLSCGFSIAAVPAPVIVTPASASIRTGQTQQFAASQIAGCLKMSWSTDKGTISSTGLYTATDTGIATITATPVYCARRAGKVQVTVTGGPPISYPLARTDHNVEQLPNPMPDWGGALGAGKTWANPAFPGTVYTRLTDSNTNVQLTLQTADSGEPQLFSADGSHVIVRNTFSHSFIVGIDGSKTGVDSGYSSVGFTGHQPLQLFALNGTQIRLLTVKPDWTGIASDVLIFDYASANCLSVGYQSTWHGTFTVSDDDLMFKTGFSNTGAQGTGNLAVAWSAAALCFVYDSLAGTVSGPAGLIGSIDDGVNPFPVRFYQHEAGGSPSSKYSLVADTVRTKNGTLPGCIVGPCLISEPYIWEIGTTHVRPCTVNCDGHSAKGKLLYTGKQYFSHFYDNADQPITPMMKFPAGFPDQHGTAHNQATGAEPIFLVSSDVTPVVPYPIWGYDEVLEVPSDGSMVVGRMGQTMNSGKSKYFICQNAVGVNAQDGHHLVITSDMGGNGALGFEKDGITPRCDVFLLTF